MAYQARVIAALVRRALNEILRVPGAALPGVLAPAIFMLGLTAVFGKITQLRGFGDTSAYLTFILPVGLLQGAGFTGAATGVNLARDIEQGWFDRLLLCPVPRTVILTGIVASAALRSLMPTTFLMLVALALGAHWPGVPHLVLAFAIVMAFASCAACWATMVALRFRTQQAAPLMQVATLISILFTTAYAPFALLAGWLHSVAVVNPVTRVLEGVRQGFVGPETWAKTWPALLALGGLLIVLGGAAVRQMRQIGR